MVPIHPALFEARDRALSGREQARLNELCKAARRGATPAAERVTEERPALAVRAASLGPV
jgi:hypothetical protein